MKKRPYRCKDRMCGADDCETCHPSTWWRNAEWEDECNRADDAHTDGEDDDDVR